MPIGNVQGDKLVVVTERGDLGHGRGKSGNWWALRAFGAMCDEQIDLPYPYTKWVFPTSIRLAVERVLNERGCELEVLSDEEFEGKLGQMKAGRAASEGTEDNG
ncbi:MAG: hypothetical protein M0Z94_20900 [Dehalococcoidales bacterium]|nr:hypothetical protein [Dehalococcoidales bacterium]